MVRSLQILKEWIALQRRGYHKHDGFPEHPVRVGNHVAYFQRNITAPVKTPKASTPRTQPKTVDAHEMLLERAEIPDSKHAEANRRSIERVAKILPKSHIRKVRGLQFVSLIGGDADPSAPKDTMGSTDLQKRVITVRADQGAATISHEIGHILFDSMPELWMLNGDLFEEMTGTGKGFTTLYAQENAMEFFCENYQFYYRQPEALKKRNPKIYNLMEWFFKRAK